MAKNTTIFTLLQNFISQEEIDGILAEFSFEDTARKCDVPTLLNYLVGAAAFEWKSLRYASDVAIEKGLKPVDYSTLSKRLGELYYLIVKRIFELIVSRLNRAARRKLKLKKELLAIDSTTITVGKNRLPWALYHGERSGIKLHVSFTNSTGMPLQVVETTGLKHDGPIGVELEDKGFIIVADRAFINEVTEILEIARTKYKITHYTCLSLLFLTGMRVGELRALQWETDIDFENNLIHINKTKDRFGSRSPKTKNSYRKFPMNESIKTILLDYQKWYEEIMETCKFRNPEGHVIITYAGEPIGERYLKRIIDLICERENTTYFTPHFLRHTFVTIQLSNNIPVSTVAALVGDTPETIYKVYAHSFAKDEVHASNLMDEIINLSSFEKTKENKK